MSNHSGQADNDVQGVLDTASILHVSEFEVFRLAYESWYGHAAEKQELDECFGRYVKRAAVPMWVRDFSRRVSALRQEGRLNPQAFGLQPPPSSSYWEAFLGGMAFTVIVMIVVLLIVMAVWTPDPVFTTCRFPPCY